jgi:hypothetical protein
LANLALKTRYKSFLRGLQHVRATLPVTPANAGGMFNPVALQSPDVVVRSDLRNALARRKTNQADRAQLLETLKKEELAIKVFD